VVEQPLGIAGADAVVGLGYLTEDETTGPRV
jgi:hypothetical protein